MPDLSTNDLEKVLEHIIVDMHKKKLLPENLNLRAVVDNIMKQFQENKCSIDMNDLKNPESALQIRKALILTIVGHSLDQHLKQQNMPSLNFNLSELFKKLDVDQKKLKLQLLNTLTMANNKMPPGIRLSENQLDELAEKLARVFTKKYMGKDDQNSMSQNKDNVDVCAALTNALYSLYGCDPRNPGRVAHPVLAVVGNYAAQIDNNPGYGPSFMGEQNTANPGQVDYTSKEGITTLPNAISMGDLAKELETALSSLMGLDKPSSHLPNPFSTTPHPRE